MPLLLTDLVEQSEVVAREDHALSSLFFCVDVDSSHQDGVGTFDHHQDEKAAGMRYPATCLSIICR
jgi:uncharacterized UPF0160 family protein